MKILCIGNSFSDDACRYIHGIARSDGETIQVTNLYIGGCPLEKHFRNMLTEKAVYELQNNGSGTGFFVSLKDALLNRSWDVVTLQQASYHSAKPHTFDPYAAALANYIRTLCPKAKILVHQTWAYEDGSAKLLDVAGYQTSAEMFADVERAYEKMAQTIDAAGIIPSGKLFQALLGAGIEKVQRDTFHASLGLGRYALGLLWYRMLTGRSVAENTYNDFDEPITPEQIEIVKKVVDQFTPFSF